MNLPVIVIGGGGHARVLIDTLLLLGTKILGFTEIASDTCLTIRDIPMLGDDKEILKYPPETVRLVNGLGEIKPIHKRKIIYEHFKNLGYKFFTVIHPSSIISNDIKISEGAQVMAGAVIQPGTSIGVNCIINTRASVDHDCYIGDHSHIAPGSILCGTVRVEQDVFVGSGSTIINGIAIGRNSFIGAGAVILHDVHDKSLVTGGLAKKC